MFTHDSSASASAVKLIARLSSIKPEALESDKASQLEALELSRKLTATLEGPANRATELVFKPFMTIAARIAVDMNLFAAIASREGKSVSTKDLALESGAEEALVSRVLRMLAAVDFVEQDAPHYWYANETTKAMASAEISAGHRFVFDILVSAAMKAPKYFREVGFVSPSEPSDGLVQYANQTKLKIFDHLATQPSLFRDFNLFMGNTMGTREYWCDWYDVEGRLLEGYDRKNNDVLLVDVAGGKGHDLQAFVSKFGTQGSVQKKVLVLQEVKGVIDNIDRKELGEDIATMEYDFFSPQPVKGARAYFFHHILHDWSDRYCHMILKQVREAMTPGYSRLLIHDLILPEVGAQEIEARFDLTMMTFNGGKERTGAEWTTLLEDAGFKVTAVLSHFDADGIVEAKVAV